MAKPVKMAKGREFEFKASKTGGAPSKYDWDGWLNPDPAKFPSGLVLLEQSEGDKDDKGTVTTISKKKDYEVDTNQMLPKIKTAARKRYKVVQTSRYDADGAKLENCVIIRARDMNDAERAREDEKRAQEEATETKRKKAQKQTIPMSGVSG